jgi:hypothetical protein
MQKVAERPFDLDSIDSTLLRVPAQRFLWNWTSAEQAAGNGRQSVSAKK